MKKFYTLAFALLVHLIAISQTVTIGTGNITSSASPWDPYYGYSYAQTIYLSSEINHSGNIISVAFDFAGTALGNSNQVVVYMGHTTKSSFSGTTDWEPVSNLTEVYNGTLSGYTLPGWVTIDFTVPFLYSGTDNLVIAVHESKPNYDGSVRFNATSLTGSRLLYYRNDNTDPDPSLPPTGVVASEVANTKLTFTTGTCFGPSGVSFSTITSSGAMASWTAPASGTTPAQYNWEVRTTGAPGSGSTGLVNSGNTITTDVTLSALSSATSYHFYVRSDCGAGASSNWSQGTFTTSCLPVSPPYAENFETTTVPGFPLCTSVENAGTGNVWETVNGPETYFPNNTLQYSYNFTNAANTWFYTKGLNLTGGVSYRLNFRYGSSSSTYTEKLEVKYGASPSATDMTDLIVDYNAITLGAAAASSTDFTPSVTGVYYIGFHAYSDPDQDNLYVDDILVMVTPTCDEPTALVHSSISTTTAQLDWTAPLNSTPIRYHIYYNTTGAVPGSATVPIDSTTSVTYNFTGLSAATKYYVWVRSYCGGGDASIWSPADSFPTTCLATNVPYTQDFETTSVPDFPTCTSGENAGTGNEWYVSSAPQSFFPSNTLEYDYNSLAAANTWFYTKGLNLAAGTSYRLTFKYGNNSTTYTEKLEVKYGASPSATDMTDLIVDYPAIAMNGAAFSATDFTPSTSGVYYIGFHAYSDPDQYNLYVDDISVMVTPTCGEPTALVHSNVMSSGAQLDWTAPLNGSPVRYHIYYSTSRTNPGSAAVPNDSTTNISYTIAGLSPATMYYAWVRSNCGGGDISIWSLADSFMTSCVAVTSFSENFDGVTDPALPACWSSILRGATISTFASVATTTFGAYSAPNYIDMYNSTSGATDDMILVSPPLSNLASGTYQLSFYAYNSDATQDLEVGTLDDNSATGVFTVLQAVDINDAGWQKYTVSFAGYTGTDHYIGIRRLSTTTFSDVYLDNINWELVPSCVEPTGTIASNILSTSAQIDWTAPSSGTPASYDVYYTTSSTAPTSSTTPSIPPVSGTTVNLALLSPATDYYVWIRSNCGTNGYSVWSGVYSFTTACPAAALNVPYVQGFESAAPPALPSCLTTENAGTGNDWITVNAPGYGFNSKTMEYPYSFTNAADAWFYTPGINLTGGTSYRLLFKYGNNDLAYTEKLEAKYGTAPAAASMSDLVVDYPSISLAGSANSATDFTPATSGIYYIGFHAYSAANQYNLYVDDVSLVLTSSVPVTISSFTGQREGAVNLLSWKTASEANNRGFEIQRSADGRNFGKIGYADTKAVNGNSSLPLNYSFADSKPFTGASYYRLKQLDKDGKYVYSKVVLIKGIYTTGLVMSNIYPNPATNQLNVVLNTPSNQRVNLVLTDLAGKVVMRQPKELVSGDNNVVLNIAQLPAGSYMLKAVCDNGCESVVNKVIKQ